MGCDKICTRRLYRFSISMLFLLILLSTHLRLIAEGRPLVKQVPISQEVIEGEKRAIARPKQIGSRPPSCERKCTSCGHCEAVQVPTNPNIRSKNNAKIAATIAYFRGDDYSNYKPMSWKCKCGSLIFNP